MPVQAHLQSGEFPPEHLIDVLARARASAWIGLPDQADCGLGVRQRKERRLRDGAADRAIRFGTSFEMLVERVEARGRRQRIDEGRRKQAQRHALGLHEAGEHVELPNRLNFAVADCRRHAAGIEWRAGQRLERNLLLRVYPGSD